MQTLLTALFLLLAVTAPNAVAFADSFTDAVTAGAGKHSKWKEIEFTEIKPPRTYRLAVIYQSPPASLAEVQRDTTAVARAVLKQLAAEGKHPKDDWTTVIVHAYRPAKGETGSAMVTSYGKTTYNFNSDSLEFVPAK